MAPAQDRRPEYDFGIHHFPIQRGALFDAKIFIAKLSDVTFFEDVPIDSLTASVQERSAASLHPFDNIRVHVESAAISVLFWSEYATNRSCWLGILCLKRWTHVDVTRSAIRKELKIDGLRTSSIFPFWDKSIRALVSEFCWSEKYLFWKNEGTLHQALRLVGFPENPRLQSQNTNGQDADSYQRASSSANNSRPFDYFAIGALSIVIGIALAWYGGGYERGDKYQSAQYVIEWLMSFGLIAVACLFVAQGAILIFFGTWII